MVSVRFVHRLRELASYIIAVARQTMLYAVMVRLLHHFPYDCNFSPRLVTLCVPLLSLSLAFCVSCPGMATASQLYCCENFFGLLLSYKVTQRQQHSQHWQNVAHPLQAIFYVCFERQND